MEAWKNIHTPHETPESFTLYFLAFVVVGKEVFYRVINRRGNETGSQALKADAWHHRSDAITSAMAFVGIGIAILLGPGYENADDWAALLASVFILYNAFRIFRPALGEIMDEHQYPDLELKVRKAASAVPGVMGTEKCRIRKSGMLYFIDLHVEVPGNYSVDEGHDISHKVKDSIRHAIPEIADVLVHIEPFVTNTTYESHSKA